MLDNVDRIAVADPDVREAGPLDKLQEMADAGLMHLDAEIVDIGIPRRRGQQGFAVTEADVEDAARVPAEDFARRKPVRAERDPPARQHLIQRTPLARRDAARTADEAADPARMIDSHCAILRAHRLF